MVGPIRCRCWPCRRLARLRCVSRTSCNGATRISPSTRWNTRRAPGNLAGPLIHHSDRELRYLASRDTEKLSTDCPIVRALNARARLLQEPSILVRTKRVARC